MENDKTEPNLLNIKFQVKEENSTSSNASSIPTPSAAPKKKSLHLKFLLQLRVDSL